MTPIAIVMLIVSTVTVWGGLAVAIWHLSRQPEHPSVDDETTVPAASVPQAQPEA